MRFNLPHERYGEAFWRARTVVALNFKLAKATWGGFLATRPQRKG